MDKYLEITKGKNGLALIDGITVKDAWTNKSIVMTNIYLAEIRRLLDFVQDNIVKNITNYINVFDKKNATQHSKLSTLQKNIINRLNTFSDKEITVGELAKSLNVTNSNLTPELNKLENDGYIYREISQINRKFIVVSLTKKGIDLITEYQYCNGMEWDKLMTDEFSEAELEQILKSVAKLNYFLNRLDKENVLYKSPCEINFEQHISEDNFKILIKNVNDTELYKYQNNSETLKKYINKYGEYKSVKSQKD